MQNLPTPSNLVYEEIEKNVGQYTIEPLYPGYGTTLGNALRRVLLSSLQGSALIAFPTKDVLHEFSTMPHVKEDVVDLILNLKLVRLKIDLEETEPVKFGLAVKGEKIITAGDFNTPTGVEIINKNLSLLTLTDDAASVEMSVYAKKGRGLVPLEMREDEKFEIGTIALDASFCPVVDVGYEITNVRVGQMTNFDKLILKITTDGTISPNEAYGQSIEILKQQIDAISNFDKKPEPAAEADQGEIEKKDKAVELTDEAADKELLTETVGEAKGTKKRKLKNENNS